jgi:hypothetical protein
MQLCISSAAYHTYKPTHTPSNSHTPRHRIRYVVYDLALENFAVPRPQPIGRLHPLFENLLGSAFKPLCLLRLGHVATQHLSRRFERIPDVNQFDQVSGEVGRGSHLASAVCVVGGCFANSCFDGVECGLGAGVSNIR